MSTLEEAREFVEKAMADKEGLAELCKDYNEFSKDHVMHERMQLALVCGLWLCNRLYKRGVTALQISSISVLYGTHAVWNDPVALAASYLDQWNSRQQINEPDLISIN